MKHTREEEEQEEDPIILKRAAVDRAEADCAKAKAELERAQRELHDELKASEAKLEADRRDWHASQEACRAILDGIEDRTLIHFNVSGTPVTLTAETLKRYPTSYFGAYLSGRWTVNAAPEFFETDPHIFSYIVSYLLSDRVVGAPFDIKAVPADQRNALKHAAKRFVLSDLVELIEPTSKVVVSPSGGTWVIQHEEQQFVTNNGMILTCTGGGTPVCALGSKGWITGVHEWSVTNCSGDFIIIGVATGAIGARKREKNRVRTKAIYPARRKTGDNSGSTSIGCFDAGELPRATSNDVYSVRLDVDARTLTFGINGVWNKSPTYTDLDASNPIHPYFDVYNNGDTLTLLSRSD